MVAFFLRLKTETHIGCELEGVSEWKRGSNGIFVCVKPYDIDTPLAGGAYARTACHVFLAMVVCCLSQRAVNVRLTVIRENKTKHLAAKKLDHKKAHQKKMNQVFCLFLV